MARIFIENQWSVGDTLEVPAEEGRHLLQVLRLEAGDKVTVVDGRGRMGAASLERVEKHKAWLKIEEVRQAVERSQIRVAFAVPKQAALDFIIHRCTEVGVQAFQPLITRHSLKPDSFNIERWQKVLREVCKQCEENFLPDLAAPISLDNYLTQKKWISLVLCDEGNRSPESKVPKGGLDVLIGAEGGWDKGEIAKIQAAGAFSLGLGKNRLRAETAALTAVILLKREIGEIQGSLG